ncbi:hypothetical protein HK101_009779 [Irineochytrium annulatum]|nr:hypothetical protein HK101_009779 [Irineochytrium annulatum]
MRIDHTYLPLLMLALLLVLAVTARAALAQGTWKTGPTTGVVGIHAALLPDDKVLLFERFHGLHAPSLYPPNPNTYVPAIGQSELSTELDMDAGTYKVLHVAYSPFCAGHAQMADGAVLVVGGDGDNVGDGYIKDGRFKVRTYTSAAGWVDIGELLVPRWYPTVTTLADGRFLVLGGHKEWYLPTAGPNRNQPTLEFWPRSGNAPIHVPILDSTSAIFNPASLEMITLPPLIIPHLRSRSFPYLSPSAILPLTARNNYTATILLCGGTNEDFTASTSCSTIRPDDPDPTWIDVGPMPVPRVMGDAIITPDGKVVFVGGARNGSADGPAGYGFATDPAFTPVVYDADAPAGSRWSTLSPATIPRLYHSSALLLPSSQIAIFGSDQQNYADFSLPPFEYRSEVLDPPYLQSSTRPTVVRAPAALAWGQVFDVDLEGDVDRLVLIRYGTATHTINMDQRMVELEWVDGGVGTRAVAPRDSALAPAGNWMLFAVSGAGVPSVGWTVRIGGGA